MRTAIFMGLWMIAGEIHLSIPNAPEIKESTLTFIAWICIIMMAMDVIDFITKGIKRMSKIR